MYTKKTVKKIQFFSHFLTKKICLYFKFGTI